MSLKLGTTTKKLRSKPNCNALLYSRFYVMASFALVNDLYSGFMSISWLYYDQLTLTSPNEDKAAIDKTLNDVKMCYRK